MAECQGFSASLMSGVVPKAQFPGLGDTGFPLAVAASLAGLVLPKPSTGASLPAPSAAHLALLPRNQPDQAGCQQSSSCLIGHQHSFAINFHCSLSLGKKDIPVNGTFRDKRLLQAVGSVLPIVVGAVKRVRTLLLHSPAPCCTCAMPGSTPQGQKCPILLYLI